MELRWPELTPLLSSVAQETDLSQDPETLFSMERQDLSEAEDLSCPRTSGHFLGCSRAQGLHTYHTHSMQLCAHVSALCGCM